MRYQVLREFLIGFIFFLAVAQASTIDSDDASIVADPGKVIEAHQQVACNDCHPMIASLVSEMPGKDRFGRKCLDCHASQPSSMNDLGQYFHRDQSRNCVDCHSFHESGLLIAGGYQFGFSGDEIVRYQCRTCHSESGDLQRLSKGHWVAREFYHRDSEIIDKRSPSASCLECHANQRNSKTTQGEVVTAIHLNSSASHPVGVLPGDLLSNNQEEVDIHKLPLFDGKMECQTCHQLNSGSKASLVKFEQEYDLCWGCHNQGKSKDIGR